ncbi:MAG: DUF2950 family protein [Planctomycetes bacterium]|nr:DUF2950 family protein [Planctomycetota bacterium]
MSLALAALAAHQWIGNSPALRAEEPAPPAPPPAAPAGEKPVTQAIDWLPKDCVFVLQADLKACHDKAGQTAFSKFLNEPDTQLFLAQPLKLAAEFYARWRARYAVLPDYAACEQLSSGDLALGLRLLPPANPNEPPRPTLCLAIRLKDANATLAALANVIEPLPTVKLASGIEARGGPGMYLAIVENWLLAAGEPDGLDQLASAAKSGKPGFSAEDRWKKTAAEIGEGCVALAWADMKPVREYLLQLPEDPNARAALPASPAKALAALGLDGVQSLTLGVGIEGPRYDFRIGVEAPAKARRGLVKLIEGEGPLHAGILAAVPREAGWFYLTRLDLRRILPLVRDSLEAAEGAGGMGQNLGTQLLIFNVATGIDLERDLLANFEDEWVLSDSGGGGALLDLMPGMTLTGTAKDPDRAERALGNLLKLLASQAPRSMDARFNDAIVDGVNVHYLSLAMSDVSPSFAVLGKYVVLSPTLAGLRRQVRHLSALPNAKDIRASTDFQAAYKTAFGTDLPEAGGKDADKAELPPTFRYLDPKRAHPTKLLGTLLGAGTAFGPNLPEILKAEEGFRKARVEAALRLLAKALEKFKPKQGEAAKPFPENPRDLLTRAGGGAASVTDLGGVRYRAGLKSDDPENTILAYAALERGLEGGYAVLRLSGKVETLEPDAFIQELKEQSAALKTQQREVKNLLGTPAPVGRASAWWSKAWGLQEEERSLLAADAVRLLRGIDFALLPDVQRFESDLPAGLSWTRADEWGMVSRTLSSYPLPAADLTGAAVPFILAGATLPEILKGRKANNETSAAADLAAIADAQKIYKLADWDGDDVHAFAHSLVELTARGLLDERIAMAEARTGAFLLPKSGYLFRLLPAQGKAAPGGEKNYLVNGKWVHGFAVLAWPADYPKTGTHTFMVGPDGAVWQADYGVFTPAASKNVQSYDPDPVQGWRKPD